MNWAISLTYQLDLDFEAYEELADTLDERLDASVFNLQGGRIIVTWWTDAPSAVKASMLAAEAIGNIVHLEPIAIEALTSEVYEIQADEPTLPRMVSAPEIGEMLGGISRQRVYQLRSLEEFPAPLVELRTGPIWDAAAIEKFGREWTRKPGRPARGSASGVVVWTGTATGRAPDLVTADGEPIEVKVFKTEEAAKKAARRISRELRKEVVTMAVKTGWTVTTTKAGKGSASRAAKKAKG